MDFELTQEQAELVAMAAGLATRQQPTPQVSWKDAGEFPWEFARELAEHGLTGISIPESIGGQGLGLMEAVLVLEAVGSNAPHLADAVQATNFGAIQQIAAFAGEKARQDVLSPILQGNALATIGMSEPGAGSAVSHLRTRAVRDGRFVRITGHKIFNSNGPHATHYVVWARFGEERDQVGAVIVPADAPGFSRGKTERFLSGEAHCALIFDDARVPVEYVLMERDGIRKLMSVFNIERLGNATRSLAFGELALRLALEHLTERETGGRRLFDYQGLQWKIADLKLRLEGARLLLLRAACEGRGGGAPSSLNTSLAKLACNESGFEAANQALQIFGGYGFSTEYPFQYLLMRTRGWMIAGGSVELQRDRIFKELTRERRARST